MNYSSIQFSKNRNDFFVTLTQRVNQYFKTKGISKHANFNMVLKTVFMYTLYLVPYVLMITGIVSGLGWMLALCLIMGVGIAGIGLSIMHDANHGAYSAKPWVNKLLGYSLNVVGGNAFNWKMQHNVLHHTYTNIHDVDEDISPRGILRLSPDSEWKSFHRFQYLYAWFAYGLMTLAWVLVKDFARLSKYEKDGLVAKQKANLTTEWIILVATKVVYFLYIFVLPVYLLPITWWHALIGFLVMHYVAGFILAVIFQPAHVVEGTEYLMPDENGNLENTWAIHQLHTTTNFAKRNRILSWYVGGLNYQVEHHLFPNICHVHYKEISAIVEQTAHEFGLPYKNKERFRDAMVGHFRMLKELGQPRPRLTPVAVSA